MAGTQTDRTLTMTEAAETLGIRIGTLLQLVRETTIWSVHMYDGGLGIKESELRRFVESGKVPLNRE